MPPSCCPCLDSLRCVSVSDARPGLSNGGDKDAERRERRDFQAECNHPTMTLETAAVGLLSLLLLNNTRC